MELGAFRGPMFPLNAGKLALIVKPRQEVLQFGLQNNTQDKDAPVNPASVTSKAEKIDLREE